MANINEIGVFDTVGRSWHLAFSNLSKFMKHLMPPYLMSSIGILIALAPAVGLQAWGMSNPAAYLAIAFLGGAAGIVVFCVYFWRYLLASVGIFKMAGNLIETGDVGDGEECIREMGQRAGAYIGLMVLLFFINLVANFTPYISTILTLVVSAFVFLAYPAFALNPEMSATRAVKESFSLVSKKFWKTLGLVITLGLVVLCLSLPFFATIFLVVVSSIASKDPGLVLVASFIALLYALFLVILMPLNTIVATLWYKKLKS